MPDSWDPMDCSPPGSSVHGLSQTRILEWVTISFSRESAQPSIWAHISCIGRQILLPLSLLSALAAQSCPTLWAAKDYSPPGSSVHGVLPGKNNGVGSHSLLQGFFPIQGSNPGLLLCRQILYHLNHQGRLVYQEGWFLYQEPWGKLTAEPTP